MATALQDFLYVFPTKIAAEPGSAVKLKWASGESPFRQAKPLDANPTTCAVQARRKLFTPDECARIVAAGEALPAVQAGVEKGENLYRVSRIRWIEPGPESEWIFHRLALAFLEANRAYRFDLIGFADALQYTVYGPDERFDWHMDLGPGRTSARKLSLTLQLSAAGEYDGGALEFVGNQYPGERELGAATIFPSYIAHRVAPVERGIRRSLVAWAYGPAFR